MTYRPDCSYSHPCTGWRSVAVTTWLSLTLPLNPTTMPMHFSLLKTPPSLYSGQLCAYSASRQTSTSSALIAVMVTNVRRQRDGTVSCFAIRPLASRLRARQLGTSRCQCAWFFKPLTSFYPRVARRCASAGLCKSNVSVCPFVTSRYCVDEKS